MVLTIGCYHYVRDMGSTRYPGVKGVTTEQFRRHVLYLKERYTLLGGADLIKPP
jgi:hypothetical protein